MRNNVKTATAIVFIVLLLGAGIWETLYVDKLFEELDEKLTTMQSYIGEENLQGSISATDETLEWWEKRRKTLEMFVYATDLRAFTVAIAEVKGSLTFEDFQNAASKTESLFAIANNLHSLLDFNISDVI